MSNRLESLNSKKPTPTPGSSSKSSSGAPKFKPKVVARKSKEERAKEAPSLKVEQPTRKPLSNRGRGGARGGRGGGRGGRNYAGTHVLSNGFLSAGAVSIGGNSSGSKLGLTSDLIYGGETGGSELISNLKLKEEKNRDDSDDEGSEGSSEGGSDGRRKINMTKEYRFREEDVVLFPVRPFRDDGIKRKEPIYNQQGEELPEDQIKPKTEPSVDASATPLPISLTQSRESSIKSENIDEKIEAIKETKNKLESKIVQGDPYAIEESNRLITDYQQILDIVTGKLDRLMSVPTTVTHKVKKEKTADDIEVDNEEDEEQQPEYIEQEEIIEPDENYVLFQLPKHLPTYKRAPTLIKLEKGVKPVDEEFNLEEITQLATHTSALRGQIGKINIHQSGKITIDLGDNNIRLNVTKGASTDFLQELAMIEMTEPKDKDKEKNDEEDDDVQMVDDEGRSIRGKLVRLGTVNEKIIATPSIQ
ncbi:DNA-directed RNA polymerase III subunit RPC4 [Candida viswanathii]|uniref:DNA-directed RNA polymerase III subunit RPC4 n=1 Tax=Candida viswanathii TaxID=5486 RepID=A0A367Y033_9ASCO|nr:DNA-directed RNA polymerase III subunit RPC4 [Candida viswanathii]